MSRFAPPPPPFMDESRSLIAEDPRDYWRALRDGAVFRELSGYYVVTRRDDVRAALRNGSGCFESCVRPTFDFSFPK